VLCVVYDDYQRSLTGQFQNHFAQRMQNWGGHLQVGARWRSVGRPADGVVQQVGECGCPVRAQIGTVQQLIDDA
jgi:hypothetical protein